MRRRSVLLVILSCLLLSVGLIGVGAPTAGAVTTHDNQVFAFGAASFHGSTDGLRVPGRVVSMASTANGGGYWIVTSSGAVYSFNAPYYGSATGWSKPIVGITPTSTGHGYWLVSSDGAVFPRGDAHQYTGMNGTRLKAPITGLIAGPNNTGYWLIASDGGVFTKGSAHFLGSTGAMKLKAPVVSMTSTPSGLGYWLVASDGGIFSFGNAQYKGSTGSMHLRAPVVGMARTGNGLGYWLAASDGGVFTFGNAQYKGSAVGHVPWLHYIAQINGVPNGDGYRMLALPIPFPPAPPGTIALQGVGASGAATVALQNRLRALGYWLPGVDGHYGADTQQAVWAFQKVEGLARTGNVDGATQARLRTAQRPRPRAHSGSLIEVNKTKQILMINRNGIAIETFNISSGSDHPYNEGGNSGSAHTPEGVFTFIRAVNGPDHGPLGTLYRPRYFTWQGHAVHGYTSVPPYPASHGCVRVANDAMDWIWATNQMPIGSSIWVYV